MMDLQAFLGTAFLTLDATPRKQHLDFLAEAQEFPMQGIQVAVFVPPMPIDLPCQKSKYFRQKVIQQDDNRSVEIEVACVHGILLNHMDFQPVVRLSLNSVRMRSTFMPPMSLVENSVSQS